ncbi:phage tail protein [Vibrio quintilis]|uniref:T4-like virus tail tube protein gp19 n=1 Tax=Vibrio quintilis TaxID=1117707 RepID=A0A1M7YUV1_9VIBR|nr:phage tail protein [Vibrio quintilis]SHO56467.1 T4-like virus tail tube protein gp19 [Vibrio quintilis]
MADTAQNIADTYPIPAYRFVVDFGDESIPFTEVSGLDIGYDTITYKDGRGIKHMPGQPTDVNITMKRGLIRQGSQFYNWIASISLNMIEKRDLSVSLTDETGETLLVTWNIINAFPTKLTAPSVSGSSNEASIESLELRADDVKIIFH